MVDSGAFQKLYNIYQDTIGAGNPVIIHDSYSLTSAPKIALAFEIFRHFDTIFATSDVIKITEHLVNTLNELRRSFAADLLSEMNDITQAINLAFALKIVDLEHACLAEVEKYLKSKRQPKDPKADDVSSDPMPFIEKYKDFATKVDNVVKHVKTLPTYQQKAEYLASLLEDNEDNALLVKHLGPAQLGRPDRYDLLMSLKAIYQQRAAIEENVIRLCNPQPLNIPSALDDSSFEKSSSEKPKKRSNPPTLSTSGAAQSELVNVSLDSDASAPISPAPLPSPAAPASLAPVFSSSVMPPAIGFNEHTNVPLPPEIVAQLNGLNEVDSTEEKQHKASPLGFVGSPAPAPASSTAAIAPVVPSAAPDEKNAQPKPSKLDTAITALHPVPASPLKEEKEEKVIPPTSPNQGTASAPASTAPNAVMFQPASPQGPANQPTPGATSALTNNGAVVDPLTSPVVSPAHM